MGDGLFDSALTCYGNLGVGSASLAVRPLPGIITSPHCLFDPGGQNLRHKINYKQGAGYAGEQPGVVRLMTSLIDNWELGVLTS